MEIIGQIVSHKLWGTGCIKHVENNVIHIEFECGIKKMIFPQAFEQFLKASDKTFENYALKLIDDIKENELNAVKTKAEKNKLVENIFLSNENHNSIKRTKKVKRENIAFKCNFCDGGHDDNHMGFRCACSEDMIDYNIRIANHTWCCNPESPCYQYYYGQISREELDVLCDGDGFVCYESKMLENWRASAGTALTGENNGKPMTLGKVQLNSLCVLTTRLPYQKEEERIIFGVFIVDDAFEGDMREEGYVTTNSIYKLELSPKEAEKLKYWNYYYNSNNPKKISWGQGLHRYLNDIQAAQILLDIAELKKGTVGEEFSKEFYEYYCKINSIDIDNVPCNNGGLFR